MLVFGSVGGRLSHTTSVGRLRRENDMRPRTGKTIGLFATALVTSLSVGSAYGGVTEFTDKDAWIAAVGRFTTVDFVGFPVGTFITEQYAGLGIHFTDGNDSISPFDPITFPNNGWGLDGNGNINVSFDSDQAWLAVDFPGHLRFQLFSEGQLIYESGLFGQAGVGNFAGLISSESFDAATLVEFFQGAEAEIDDLHFGVPSPGVIALLALGGLHHRRRRDSCCAPAIVLP